VEGCAATKLIYFQIYDFNLSSKITLHSSNPTITHKPNPTINTADLSQFPFLPTNQRQELNNNNNNNNYNINIVPIPLHQPIPYSQIVTQNQQSSNVAEQLSAFLNEFIAMFNQLIGQNSMIINMLSTVINKIVN
jgi:ABC-type molybdate transport system substrate-binding protein